MVEMFVVGGTFGRILEQPDSLIERNLAGAFSHATRKRRGSRPLNSKGRPDPSQPLNAQFTFLRYDELAAFRPASSTTHV